MMPTGDHQPRLPPIGHGMRPELGPVHRVERIEPRLIAEFAQEVRAGDPDIVPPVAVPIRNHNLAGQVDSGPFHEVRFDQGIEDHAMADPVGLQIGRGRRIPHGAAIQLTEHIPIAREQRLEDRIDEIGPQTHLLCESEEGDQMLPGAVMDGAFPVDHDGIDPVQSLPQGTLCEDATSAEPMREVVPVGEVGPIGDGHARARQHQVMPGGHRSTADMRHPPGIVEEPDPHQARLSASVFTIGAPARCFRSHMPMCPRSIACTPRAQRSTARTVAVGPRHKSTRSWVPISLRIASYSDHACVGGPSTSRTLRASGISSAVRDRRPPRTRTTSRPAQRRMIRSQYAPVLRYGAESGRLMNALAYRRLGLSRVAHRRYFCQYVRFAVASRFGIPTMHAPDSSRIPLSRAQRVSSAP